MSVLLVVTPEDLPATGVAASTRPRIWIRALAFAALALYGVDRWARLLHDAPGWRLVGLALAAVALAVVVPLVRHLTAGWPAAGGRVLSGLIAAALVLACLPIAGVRWQWVVHLRIAVSARAVGSGLGALGDVLVPYLGSDYPTRLVIVLGAAVLLLDGAAALAFAGREIGDGRRAAAALPLIALAVVPSTLVHPAAPALQGLVLFGLLALFIWGERIARNGRGAAVGLACAAGVAGAIVGPVIEQRSAWLDYRAWTGSVPSAASFDWNQSYGPLRWPQDGRAVFTVRARRGEYWKATDLDQFDGRAWVQGDSADAVLPLPAPRASALRRWTQTIQVTITGMTTQDVIGAGVSQAPHGAGRVINGPNPGTWVAASALHPGSAYLLRSYAPDPTAVQLRRDHHRYPWARLQPYLSATIPDGGPDTGIPFAPFGATSSIVALEMAHSPYARAYALARRLAAGAATPYAFVKAVQHYLDDGAYRYDQKTTPTRYPLLDFLFHSKVGYCQQFSGAMALLLRMGGVPARVAAGFTSGSFNPAGHAWTVSDIDAHAWVEVWFPRYGWVKFDPTPTSAPARSGAPPTNDEHEEQLLGFDHTLRLGETQGEVQSNTTTTTTTSRHRTRGSAGAGAGSGSGGSGPTWPWLAGGGLLVLGLAGGGWWRGARVSRHGDPLTELERALARTGRPLRAGVTLAELERRFHDSPEAAGYVRALRLARYGGLSEPLSGAGRRALRAELRLGLGLAGRLRALWALPPRLPSRLQSRLHRT